MQGLLADAGLEEDQIVVVLKYLRSRGEECLSKWREDEGRLSQPLEQKD